MIVIKKALICIGLVLAGLSTGIFADEIYTTVVDRKIRYEGQRITTKYPVLSYDNTTYIAVRDVAGIPISEMINRSFYEVFENGDKKWLVTYADVALNGNKHTLTDYSPEIDKHLTIYCYQPIPGYCACILIPK